MRIIDHLRKNLSHFVGNFSLWLLFQISRQIKSVQNLVNLSSREFITNLKSKVLKLGTKKLTSYKSVIWSLGTIDKQDQSLHGNSKV